MALRSTGITSGHARSSTRAGTRVTIAIASSGYLRYFHDPASKHFAPRNAAAYASLGGAMELTRFYYADAAAQIVLADQQTEHGLDPAAISSLLKSLNNVLRYIVEAYLLRRGEVFGFSPQQ